MIGKVITGRSFAGCIAYNLQREEASILDASGVRTTSVKDITSDFNFQRKLNPNLGQAVGHIVLSWSAEDKVKLNDAIMVERAKEYMHKMKIRDTQYLIVQHTDRQHPHLHLVYNRVGNDGKTISDRYQKVVNAKVCKEITLKYGYHLAEGKAQVNRRRLKGSDQIKYEIYDAIKAVAKVAQNWQQLEAALLKQGIQTHYKYLTGTDTVQGISFSKGITKFKGSEIDRGLSYGKINQLIEFNKQHGQRQRIASVNDITLPNRNSFSDTQGASLLGKLLESDHQQDAPTPFELLRTKRKLKKGRRI
jgi:hypothetical protein